MPPENTAPGITVTAADCAGLHPALSPHPGCDVRQVISPVVSWSANMPLPGSGIGFHRGPEGRSPARTLDLFPTEIGNRHINVFAIHRGPPLDAAELTALPYPGLPQDLAVTVRINRVHQTRLLAGNQRTPPSWQTHKDGSRPEVEKSGPCPSGQFAPPPSQARL